MKNHKLICNKEKCGCEEFNILKMESCSDCEYNGAYDPDDETSFPSDYVYDEKIIKEKGLGRSQASEEGECNLQDYNYDNGCWIISCSKCGYMEHSIPCGDG